MTLKESELEHLIQREVRVLAEEYRGRVPEATVAEQFAQALREYDGARVKDFVPLFVVRQVRERLG